jgi:TM2 domain-containing membrane protein YozV
MKNKNIAGLLALFFGFFGIHRFYLGQTGLGIFYLIFLPISWLISFIDAIVFFSMDKENFNIKYNKEYYKAVRREVVTRKKESTRPNRVTKKNISRADVYKNEGKEKFKNYDYQGAIEQFNKALDLLPNDLAVHFNLACTYSLLENVEKGYFHLDRSVANGFNDFNKIRSHEALSFLRVQPQFKKFEQNGYRLIDQTIYSNSAEEQFEIEDQIDQLHLLKKRGLLTNSEFLKEKEKLLNR